MSLFLEVIEGKRAGESFEVKEGAIVSRSRGEITLDDPKVSSRHAKVELRDDGYYLVDLGSTNGLKINGKKFSEIKLLPEVQIQIGRSYLVVNGELDPSLGVDDDNQSQFQGFAPEESGEFNLNQGSLGFQDSSEVTGLPDVPSKIEQNAEFGDSNIFSENPQTQSAVDLFPSNTKALNEIEDPDSLDAPEGLLQIESPEEADEKANKYVELDSAPEPSKVVSGLIDIEKDEDTEDQEIFPDQEGYFDVESPSDQHDLNSFSGEDLEWVDHLGYFCDQLKKKELVEEKVVVPFPKTLKLEFYRGQQTGTEWVLGYGPRKVGTASVDLKIHEPGAPDTCFELLPSPDGLRFATQFPDIVQLNNQPSSSELLKDGDVISIKETHILVGLIDDPYS